MNWDIPFFSLSLGEEEKRAVLETLDSNWLTMGPRIAQFENEFAARLGEGVTAAAVANCTAALHLAMIALGIRSDDEVIVPSLTFVATANAARFVGAKPVFADVRSETDWTISPEDVEAKITPRAKAIVVVHYAGYPCQMEELLSIAARHRLKVIEDAAHALFSWHNGQALGTFGDIGCFSFFSNKNMTTGEGGMATSRDAQIVERIRLLRSHGMTRSSFERFRGHAFGYDVIETGYNYRLNEIGAALGLAQLMKLDANNEKRRTIVTLYRTLLRERLSSITVPFAETNGRYAYHIFPVLLPADGPDRETVMERLQAAGIQTSIHYRPVHTLTAFERQTDRLPITERIAPRILTLPLYPEMSEGQVTKVVSTLAEAVRLG